MSGAAGGPPSRTRSVKKTSDRWETDRARHERPLLIAVPTGRTPTQRTCHHGLVVPAPTRDRVTIVPRGHALGVTYQRPDATLKLAGSLFPARIVACWAAAAEEIVYGTTTTGAKANRATTDWAPE